MTETEIRDLFTGIAGGEPETTRVDPELARRRGKARLRWRRAAAAGAPLLAAATAMAIIVTVGLAPGQPRQGAAAAGNGPAAPRQFDPLVPYLSFGWLPAGNSLMMGGIRRTVVSIEAGNKPFTPEGWDLSVFAAGQCHLAAASKALTCHPDGTSVHVIGPAPSVGGHRAWWIGSARIWWAGAGLAWQYARDGWAWLTLPNMYRDSPQQHAAVKRDAVKIAGHVRYGAPTPPLLFPAQLTGLPSSWRVSSVVYQPDSSVLRADLYALAGNSPSLGSDAGLDFQSGLPYLAIDPLSQKNPCVSKPGEPASHTTINGFRVLISHSTVGNIPGQSLCAAHAGGFRFDIREDGPHPAIGVASLFRSHLRLLGPNPANWTRKPIG